MNNATQKEPKANPENLEKTTWTFEEAETKLKEEVKKFQDAGEEILNQYENIANIQKEIDNTKQIFVRLFNETEKKEGDFTPKKIFEEFKVKFREKCSKEYKDSIKAKVNKEKNSAKFSILSIIVVNLLVLFSIFWIISSCNIKSPEPTKTNEFIYIGFLILALIIYSLLLIFYKNEAKKEIRFKYSIIVDIGVFVSILVVLVFAIWNNLDQGAMLWIIDCMKKLSISKKICLIIAMILLIILDHKENQYRLLLAKEKEDAVPCIKAVLDKAKMNITVDLIQVLIASQNKLQNELISEFSTSIIFKIMAYFGLISSTFLVIVNFIYNLESLVSSLICFVLSLFVIILFCLYHKAVHDKDLYIEALKDIEFKEALEISKKGR